MVRWWSDKSRTSSGPRAERRRGARCKNTDMKKRILIAASALAVLFVSCDSKLCYCYTPTAEGTYESEVYTSSDKVCNSMNHGDYACVERNERMPVDELAHK